MKFSFYFYKVRKLSFFLFILQQVLFPEAGVMNGHVFLQQIFGGQKEQKEVFNFNLATSLKNYLENRRRRREEDSSWCC